MAARRRGRSALSSKHRKAAPKMGLVRETSGWSSARTQINNVLVSRPKPSARQDTPFISGSFSLEPMTRSSTSSKRCKENPSPPSQTGRLRQCLRGGTGPPRFRRPCGSRPEGLARRCRRPLHSRVPRTPTFRPVACRTRLAWRARTQNETAGRKRAARSWRRPALHRA